MRRPTSIGGISTQSLIGRKFTLDDEDWTFTDDLSGTRFPASEAVEGNGNLTGLMMAEKHGNEIDDQLRVESKKDSQSVPWSRPDLIYGN